MVEIMGDDGIGEMSTMAHQSTQQQVASQRFHDPAEETSANIDDRTSEQACTMSSGKTEEQTLEMLINHLKQLGRGQLDRVLNSVVDRSTRHETHSEETQYTLSSSVDDIEENKRQVYCLGKLQNEAEQEVRDLEEKVRENDESISRIRSQQQKEEEEHRARVDRYRQQLQESNEKIQELESERRQQANNYYEMRNKLDESFLESRERLRTLKVQLQAQVDKQKGIEECSKRRSKKTDYYLDDLCNRMKKIKQDYDERESEFDKQRKNDQNIIKNIGKQLKEWNKERKKAPYKELRKTKKLHCKPVFLE
ncbi:hypothetical protein EC973_001495 [Apophysomyces ossiformis]|uniref:Uncharacterized protein n=1 Tax=Apophysomyces ossiformis TaxID=679940 RepID=A0A8H7BJH1_9FUNG|nr:hypothetical protein EC973_001495 [Apophysomyces ossiformis]